jgi:hypothetical protein
MTIRPGRGDEILLEPPLVDHGDVVPAIEDRSYIVFIAGAMGMGVTGGFALAVAVSLAASGVFWEDRLPWLIQAHGSSQLEGWAGLFVAGMGLRLLPRFAGRRPLPKGINLSVFALLFSGVVVRTIAQPAAGAGLSAAGLLMGQLLWSAGAVAFAGVVAITLLRGRGRGQPWHAFAFAGVAWWLACAAASVAAGVRAAHNDAYVPNTLDDAMTWTVMLGAIGNFIWAVQSRSVPIFFGRKIPTLRRAILPGLFLNSGIALIFAAGWLGDARTVSRLTGSGFLLGGAGLISLAPLAGSCWGAAKRLRPRARSAARFVLFANRAAVVCGALLIWAGIQTLGEGEFAAAGVRDAARHAFGVGVITLLIVGMAQLVAPFFALRRAESQRVWLVDHGIFWLLATAAILRVSAGLLVGHVDTDVRMHIAAVAGSLAWAGLVLFAITVFRAVRNEPRIRAALAVDTSRAARPR